MSTKQTVLLGDPTFFRIKSGANPHTRDRFGRRKKVHREKACTQWRELRRILESYGVKVHVLDPVEEEPGLAFPANAGFRCGDIFYLSNLNRSRAGEREYYRRALETWGMSVRDLPSSYPFEGEADFIPVGDPSGDLAKTLYLFTYGRIETPRWVPHAGFPPYRRIYGFRSDHRILSTLRSLVEPCEVLPLELVKEAHYHGDTVLCPFGPKEEYLLAFLEGLSPGSQATLRRRLGQRLIPLSESDASRFAANSFQISTEYYGACLSALLMPDGITQELYQRVRSFGVIPYPVDVSEFLEKGGGAVKCMLLNLGRSGAWHRKQGSHEVIP